MINRDELITLALEDYIKGMTMHYEEMSEQTDIRFSEGFDTRVEKLITNPSFNFVFTPKLKKMIAVAAVFVFVIAAAGKLLPVISSPSPKTVKVEEKKSAALDEKKQNSGTEEKAAAMPTENAEMKMGEEAATDSNVGVLPAMQTAKFGISLSSSNYPVGAVEIGLYLKNLSTDEVNTSDGITLYVEKSGSYEKLEPSGGLSETPLTLKPNSTRYLSIIPDERYGSPLAAGKYKLTKQLGEDVLELYFTVQ